MTDGYVLIPDLQNRLVALEAQVKELTRIVNRIDQQDKLKSSVGDIANYLHITELSDLRKKYCELLKHLAETPGFITR